MKHDISEYVLPTQKRIEETYAFMCSCDIKCIELKKNKLLIKLNNKSVHEIEFEPPVELWSEKQIKDIKADMVKAGITCEAALNFDVIDEFDCGFCCNQGICDEIVKKHVE